MPHKVIGIFTYFPYCTFDLIYQFIVILKRFYGTPLNHNLTEPVREPGEITPVRASQHETLDHHFECCPAKNAIDRDLATGSMASARSGYGWIKLEFRRTYFIHKVVIYGRFYTDWFPEIPGYCSENESQYQRCLNYDLRYVDVAVYRGDTHKAHCGRIPTSYGLKQEDQIYTMFCNAMGDTVKLEKRETEYFIGISEIVVASFGKVFCILSCMILL